MEAARTVADTGAHLTIVPPGGQALTPMDLLDRAVANGAGIEYLTQLMTLQERWEKNQARKAFDNAMADAKAEIPVIIKNREVDFTSTKGRTHYRYEDLAGIVRTVDPILSKHGLSYRYRTSSAPNEPVSVTCIVSHRHGHSEENTLQAGRDESGNKNPIQSIGSTLTYLQRLTLKAALGLAASEDDDGKASSEDAGGGPITAAQAKELRELLDKHERDVAAFCRAFRIDALPELPVARFEEAKQRITAPKPQGARQ